MMTRKHYNAIADVIKEAVDLSQDDCERAAMLQGIYNVAQPLSVVMAQDNPNFSQSRFLMACGLAT